MTGEKQNHENNGNNELDVASLRILEAIIHEGGEATTTEIRQYTGLDKNTVHYRMNKKLPGLALVETHNRGTDSKGGRSPTSPKLPMRAKRSSPNRRRSSNATALTPTGMT